MSRYTLKRDKRYTMQVMPESSWLMVKMDDTHIALCMNKDTAKQVIFKHIKENGGECEYLFEEDFTQE